MKAMTDEAASPVTRKSSQQTLYTCLDLGLRMLHPFMPFVTEELWQRLPRRPNDSTESIMIASFPTFVRASVFLDPNRPLTGAMLSFLGQGIRVPRRREGI